MRWLSLILARQRLNSGPNFNFTYPVRCLRVPPGVRIPQVEDRCFRELIILSVFGWLVVIVLSVVITAGNILYRASWPKILTLLTCILRVQILCFWTLSIALFLSKNAVLFIIQNTTLRRWFCLRLQVKRTQFGPIDRAIPYLRRQNPVSETLCFEE
jgi:hypothetical protein